MEGFLAMMDPAPLFPEDGAVVFYDGQPRDENGRFTFGRMPNYSLVLESSAWKIDGFKTNERVKNIMGILDGVKLKHDRITGNTVSFYPKGIKHTIGTYRTKTLERFMRSPVLMAEVFRRGDCREEPVHKDKRSYADKCWHVKASVHFNRQRSSRIEFVVIHHIHLGKNVLYDVRIK